jgi:hypothetical protein
MLLKDIIPTNAAGRLLSRFEVQAGLVWTSRGWAVLGGSDRSRPGRVALPLLTPSSGRAGRLGTLRVSSRQGLNKAGWATERPALTRHRIGPVCRDTSPGLLQSVLYLTTERPAFNSRSTSDTGKLCWRESARAICNLAVAAASHPALLSLTCPICVTRYVPAGLVTVRPHLSGVTALTVGRRC